MEETPLGKTNELYFPGNVYYWKCNALSNSTVLLLKCKGLGLKILLKNACEIMQADLLQVSKNHKHSKNIFLQKDVF